MNKLSELYLRLELQKLSTEALKNIKGGATAYEDKKKKRTTSTRTTTSG